MPKLRVYQLARELNRDNAEIIRELQHMGVPVTSHSNTVEDRLADRLRKELGVYVPNQAASPAPEQEVVEAATIEAPPPVQELSPQPPRTELEMARPEVKPEPRVEEKQPEPAAKPVAPAPSIPAPAPTPTAPPPAPSVMMPPPPVSPRIEPPSVAAQSTPTIKTTPKGGRIIPPP